MQQTTGITSVEEAWKMIGAVKADIRRAKDTDEQFECRTGCLSSAKQKIRELQRFSGELLMGLHGSAAAATHQELLLPIAVRKLAASAARL